MQNNKNLKQHAHREPLVYITKRGELSKIKTILIKAAVILAGVLCCAIITMILTGENPLKVFSAMFKGSFGTPRKLWNLLQASAILLGISLAVTPAFKMRFWNTGAEGQVLIGMLASVACMFYLGDSIPSPLLIVIMFFASVIAGAVWAGVPGFFKAIWNTNETLFTLMMNYVATQIIKYYVYIEGGGSNTIQPVDTGNLPIIGDNRYLLNVIIVAVLTIGVFVYQKYSKQGYEISVVGESQNTAKYVGINVKKVIIRTMVISGAICGIAGMLLVAGTDHSINTNTVGGQGFTAIMVSWLGQFNPFIMVLMSALVVFLRMGSGKVADTCALNSSFADIAVGIVILFVVGCEFFIRYSVKFKHSKKEVKA